MFPTIRLPSNPVTPHGGYHILHDRIPQVNLRSFDNSIVLHMMGGLAIAARETPERVELKGIKGLVPPWRTIDQKGATQDGVTFVDALYDPIEVTLDVECVGRDAAHCRKVGQYLIGALDVKQESFLSFFTHDLGYWWAPIRWFRTPDNDELPTQRRQRKSLRVRADSGFWQSYPNVEEYSFAYKELDEQFNVDYPDSLGPNWDVVYSGDEDGTGTVFVDDRQAASNLRDGRTAVCRHNQYVSGTDYQILEIRIGRLWQWFYPIQAQFDMWVRMKTTGTPGSDGIRLRFKRHHIEVHSFENGVATKLREEFLTIPLLFNERIRVIVGMEGAGRERIIRVERNGITAMIFKDFRKDSQMGPDFRGIGIGFNAERYFGIQRPPGIRYVRAADNAKITQSAFVKRINAGDQPAWDRITLFGPFDMVKLWDGPGAGPDEYVEFGPLVEGQVVQIRTDPRKYGVVDLTTERVMISDWERFKKAMQDFLSFSNGGNVPKLIDAIRPITTLFDGKAEVWPPQGNLYPLLKGRFSRPIPPKSPGKPAVPYYRKIEIVGGNADSKILMGLTPLRRYPY